MRARILNGVKCAVNIEDGDLVPAHGKAASRAGRNLSDASDADKSRKAVRLRHRGKLMVRDYRAWLQSEMQLPGAEGEMARRALDRLDMELGERVVLELEPEQADLLAAELDALAQAEALPDALVELLQIIRTVPI